MPSIRCYYCGETNNYENLYRSINGAICESCRDDHYFTCDSCDEICPNDDYDRDGICINCAEENDRGCIEDACHVPDFKLTKMPWENTLYQGVELEVECGEDEMAGSKANGLAAFLDEKGLGKSIYMKEDGSLDNGFEIVSHPFTAQARHKHLNWREILKYLRQNGIGSANNGYDNCGLHIHVSRASLTAENLRRLKLFFSAFSGRIEKIAGREANHYCQFEGFDMARYKALRRYSVFDLARAQDGNRYLAVNINAGDRKPTVEFRIFAGTTYYKHFIARLQFVEAICDFVKVCGAPVIASANGFSEFKTFVRRENRWKQLERHFQAVGV